MALFMFTQKILAGEPIDVFIAFIISASNSLADLLRYIEILEDYLGKKTERKLLPLQPGDVPDTYANVGALVDDVGYKPSTPIVQGVANFVEWYRDYYRV